MPPEPVTVTPAPRRHLTRADAKPLLIVVVWMAVWAAILFACAGTLEWWQGRLYIAVITFGVTMNWLIVSVANPGLFAERAKKHTGTKRFDKLFSPLFTILSLAMLVIAGLEERFHARSMGHSAALFGALLYLIGVAPMTWAMSVNPHLERTVRIQADRDHRVITEGPYRLVRHPMYVGLIFSSLSAPLIFGSPWTWAPTGLIAFLVVWRTALEDRTLRAELAGYADYALRTRYRIVPGLW